MKRKTKRSIKRERAKKGYSWWDVMDIDCWFLDTIPKMLKEFNERHNGFPSVLEEEWLEDNKDRIPGNDNYEKRLEIEKNEELRLEMEIACFDKWNSIIDRMIILFADAENDNNVDEGLALFTKYFHYLWY